MYPALHPKMKSSILLSTLLSSECFFFFSLYPHIYTLYKYNLLHFPAAAKEGQALLQICRRRDFPYMLSAALLGSVFHFLYDFSGENPFAALISPVNESVWEHLKLLFFPILLLTAIEFLIRHPNPCALFGARLAGITAGMTMIVVLYYLYTFVLGRNFLAADILLFLTGVCFSYVISGHLFRKFRQADPMLVFLGWLLAVLLFFSFTCFPPDIFLFYPP